MRRDNLEVINDINEDDATIWRYLEIPQLLSMLINQKLHFTKITDFPDKYEGTLPAPDLAGVEAYAQKFEKDPDEIIQTIEGIRDRSYANCWCLKDTTSSVMWRAFSDYNTGVVIKSTYNKLKEILDNCYKTEVYLGTVDYIDYSLSSFAPKLSHKQLFHKRKEFAEENEVRAVIIDNPQKYSLSRTNDVDLRDIEQSSAENRLEMIGELNQKESLGHHIDTFVHNANNTPESHQKAAVDIEYLVDYIKLAPGSAEWHKQTIEKTIDRLGFDIPVAKTSNEPLH